MINLKKLIGEVSLELNGFSKKIYVMVDPGLKVSHKRKRFYTKKDNFPAKLITTRYILKGYLPTFNSEDI